MKRQQTNLCLLLILHCFVLTGIVHGHELATHGRLTQHSYERSVLNTEYLNTSLGLIDGASPFGSNYLDVYQTQIFLRKKDDFEEAELRMPEEVNPLSVKGWLMRGAIREDDIPPLFGENPQDDPYGPIFRIVNHFYDPRNDQALTIGIPVGKKAPDWGIGANDAFADQNDADTFRRNHFTVFDARESMFRALTGMDKNGSQAIGVGGTVPATATDKETVRKAYWATTFRALGDLVHLIQDMAQPQHTRNDAHAGIVPALTGHKSYYERYINERAKVSSTIQSDNIRLPLKPLVYDTSPSPYPTPTFNDYVSYFSVQHTQSDVIQRTGLADYSNRGFFSIGKNLGNTDYDQPSNSIASYTPQQLVVDSKGNKVDVLFGSVSDAYTNSSDDTVPLTTWGIWNDALQAQNPGGAETFTLIQENYDAMADLLIPRAVAYSAGLIDYFFRGHLEITPPKAGVYALLDHAVVNQIDQGFTKVKLNLRNTTADIDDGQTVYPQEMTNGQLFAVAKFRRNPCYQPDLSGEVDTTGNTINGCSILPNPTDVEEIVVSQPLAAVAISRTVADEFVFDFSQAPIPINATDLYLQVVYRGVLGSEQDAVVVATLDIHEPTFVTVANATDFNVENGIYRLVDDPSQQSFPITDLLLRFNNSVSNAARLSSLAVGDFVRLAILTDKDPFTWLIMGFTPSTQVLNNVESWSARVAQHDAAGAFAANPANPLQQPFRGTHWFNLFHFVGNGGDGTDSTDFSPMSSAPFATAPVPIGWDEFNNTQ
jgi:hypothetical protein